MDIITELNKELKEIDKALHLLEKRHTDTKDLGSISARTVRGTSQYHYRAPGADKAVYVPKKDIGKLKVCAQAEFENRTEKDLIKQKRNIEQFLKQYDKNGVNAIYYKLCDGRKELVTPLKKTNEAVIEEWLNMHPGNMNVFPKEATYLTERGDEVRSKSELIIADMLYRNNIPYQYETKICISDGKCLYPDFTVLNVSKRKTIYWEHLGLLSDDDYAKRNFEKICLYERNGFMIGDNLIVTMETTEAPLDRRIISKLLEVFLL